MPTTNARRNRASYSDIERYLAEPVPENFSGTSMSGRWDEGGEEFFRIYSYGTQIAWMTQAFVSESEPGYKGTFYVIPGRYSTTTSRHQALVRKVWAPIYVDHAEFLTILEKAFEEEELAKEFHIG